MLSATLEAGLSDYAIGAKIRALRLKKKMGLVELGQHSGLSPALLSKLEKGAPVPDAPDNPRAGPWYEDVRYCEG